MSTDSGKNDAELAKKLEDAEHEIARLRSLLNLQLNEDIGSAFKNEKDSNFAHLLDLIPIEISVLDSNRRYLYINQHHDLSNAEQQKIIGKTDDEVCAALGLPESVAINRTFLFNSTLFEKQPKSWEENYPDENGHEKFMLRTMIPVLNRDLEFHYMLSIANDITEQVTTERIVRNSEERYRLMVNGAREYMLVQLDAEGLIVSWNTGAIDITGYEPHEVHGKPWSTLYSKQGENQYKKDFTQHDSKLQQDIERILHRRDGESFYAEMNVSKLYNLHNELIGYAVMARDLTQQREGERALRESEEKYRSIIEDMNMGLIETDENDNITFVNKSFSSMSGITHDNLMHQTPEAAFLDQCKIKVLRKGTRDGVKGNSLIEEVQYPRKHGEYSWWLISVTPRYDNSGEFTGSLAIILDITDRKILETELDAALKNAESLAAAKQIFLANMSHELRTPLNAVIGLTRLLQKESLTPKQQQYIGSIIYSGNNLLNIIEDLLDFSKLEAGKMTLSPTAFNIHELIRNNLKMLHFKAEEKGIALEGELDPDLYEYTISDAARINQILINLVGNAVKFTNHGKVKLSCKVLDDKPRSQLLQFMVSDTGIGIPADKIDKVFEMFYQVGYNNPSMNKGGTGLGLSITKQLIERLGGKIELESGIGKGTSIRFTIRVGKGKLEPLETTTKALIPTTQLKGKEILLAEDNEINRMLVLAILEPLGIHVTEAVNGADAVKWCEKKAFDLILMDIRMPELNGVDATRAIRNKLNKTLPIIALTADITEDAQRDWMEAGMNEVILKPFDEGDLLLKMSSLMGLIPTNEPLPILEKPEIVIEAAKPNQQNALNLERLLHLTHGDQSFLNKMLGVFSIQMEESFLQIKEALNPVNFLQLREILHKIKPGVINTCHPETADLLQRLNEQVRSENNQLLEEQFDTLELAIRGTLKAISEYIGNQ